MRVFSAQQVHSALSWTALDSALTAAFAVGAESPLRPSYALNASDSLLLMPSWTAAHIGVKVVTVMPNNRGPDAPTVGATYLLMSRATGAVLAVVDGEALTVRRTAMVSAIAARYMARANARTLLVVGTGTLSPWMVRAHFALRPAISRVLVWGRNSESATTMVEALASENIPVELAVDLQRAAQAADIVSCVTTALSPVVTSDMVKPGTHIDLVGGFTPAMREADTALIVRGRVVVDSYRGAMTEAGDIVVPLQDGAIAASHVVAELAELVRGERVGRLRDDDVTVFKSVGTALADLAAATLLSL